VSALAQMYQAAILEHARRTRHRGVLDPADARQEGINPSCGDELLLTLRFSDDAVTEVRYEGKGCAISQASASLMAEAIEGRSREEAEALIGHVKAMIHGEGCTPTSASWRSSRGFGGCRRASSAPRWRGPRWRRP
jgi:nitrogen fixation protein NifU and related proteins